MKKLTYLLLVLVLLLVSCGSDVDEPSSVSSESSETSEADTVIYEMSAEAPANDLCLNAEDVSCIHITTMPENLDIKCYSSSDIERVIDYFSLLNLESDFPENADEYLGMAYDVIIKYKNGESREFIHFGNMFFKEVGSDWRKMSYDQASEFEEIVSSLNSVPDDLDGNELIERAEAEIALLYGIEDMSFYKVELEQLSDGRLMASFDLYIYGYKARERYRVTFASNGEIIDTSEISGGTYSCYLPYVSEESVKSAELKLAESLKKHDGEKNPYYDLLIDSDGYLCLSVEVIVNFDVSDTDGDGYIEEGCGIDHEHIFYSERISDKGF